MLLSRCSRIVTCSGTHQYRDYAACIQVPYFVKRFGQSLQQMKQQDQLINAFASFEKFEHKNNVTFNIMLDSFFKSGNLHQGEQFFHRYAKIVKPDVRSFNSMIEGFIKTDVSKARELFFKMKDYNVEPNEYTYRIFIYAAETAQDAVQEFEKLKQNVKPDMTCINTLITRLFELGAINDAIHVYATILKNGSTPSKIVFGTVINWLFHFHMFNEGLTVFDEMLSRGIEPNVIILTSMIDGYFRAKKFKEGRKMLMRMIHEKIDPNVVTFTCMVDGYVKAKMFDVAEQTFHEMLACKIEPNEKVFTTMMNGYFLENKMEHVERIQGLMKKHLGYTKEINILK
jgi:pentatricopeptide repeat protein